EDEEDADEGHGDSEEDAERLPNRLEEGGGHHEDEDERDGENAVDLALFLTRPSPPFVLFQGVARGQLRRFHDGLVDAIAELGRSAELVADVTLVLLVLADDDAEDLALLDGGDLSEADTGAGAGGDEEALEAEDVHVPAPVELDAEPDLLSGEGDPSRKGLAPHRRLHVSHDVDGGQVVHRQPVAVDAEDQLR